MKREINLFKKMQKAFALAGDNPTTEEELSAHKIAMDIKRKLERKNHRNPILQQIGYGGLIPYDSTIMDKSDNKINWKEYLKVKNEKVITLQVIPDTSTRNYKTEDIAKTITQLFQLPIDRVKRDGFKVTYKVQEKVSFEIRMTRGEIIFLFHIPESIQMIFTKKLQSVWEKCTIAPLTDNKFHYTEENTVIQELSYRKHDLYSLSTDSKNNDPLGSIFESSRLLEDGEYTSVFASFEPIHQLTVQSELQEVWRKLRDGNPPSKWSLSFRHILFLTGIGVSKLFQELTEMLGEILSSEKDAKDNRYTKKYVADPHANRMVIDNLKETKTKPSKDILKVSLLVATHGKNAEMKSQATCNAFSDIASDNDLVNNVIRSKSKKREVIKSLNERRMPKVNIKTNLMSVAEVGRLIQLPGDELITRYKNITSIKNREIEVDKALRKGGLKLGEVTFRGEKIPVYIPCVNYDELCLPVVIIGGMGMGKSYNIANRAIEYNKAGFGCIVIDPGKGEIGDNIERVLPPENVVRYNLSDFPMSLDWCEVEHLKRARNRLANAVMGFFNTQSDEIGARTGRYLKAMVHAMQTFSVAEIVKILEDDKYRKHLLKYMPDNFYKVTIQEFHDLSDAMKMQVKGPIYNRLDIILGDEFLVECMDSPHRINMVELMQSNKCIIFDVKKQDLGEEGVDLLCNLLSSKIDLAMTSRDQDKARPFFILFDELHQMQRSTEIWKGAAVESRKWRVGYNFILHGFDQVDRKLIQIIQDAGPNYCLFRSSENTFQKLANKIKPFEPADGMKLQRYHAINVINADGRVIEPFICKMNDPL